MSWFIGPSKEKQESQLQDIQRQMMAAETPVQKKQKEIEYNKLFYKVYPKSLTEEAYFEQLSRLNEELARAKKEQGTPSIFQGWDQVAAAADTVTKKASPPRSQKEIKDQQKLTNEIFLLGGNKKSKRTKSKRTKSKKSKRTKSKKSKRTKK